MRIAGCVALFCLALSARAETLSWLGGDANWSVSQAEVVKPQLGASYVQLRLADNQGLASLGRQVELEPLRDYELTVDYKSSNERSGRNQGSWLWITFSNAANQPFEPQWQVFEQAPVWKTKTVRITPPAGAARMSLAFRQQQAPGIFDIKTVGLCPAAAVKTAAAPDPLDNLLRIERFSLGRDAAGKRILIPSSGPPLASVNADGKFPLSFVLPDQYCEDPTLVYVLDVKFATGFDAREATGNHALFTLGRNMTCGRVANSISMTLWGGIGYFTRVTTANPGAQFQVAADAKTRKAEPRGVRAIVAASGVASYLDGKLLGKEKSPSDQFVWPKGRPFFLGAEDATWSLFKGDIQEFSLTVMRPRFTLSLDPGAAYLVDDGPHELALRLTGDVPELALKLLDGDDKELAIVPLNNSVARLPALPFGCYTLSAVGKDGKPLGFDFQLAIHPELRERPPAAESPFGVTQGLPLQGTPGDRAFIERWLELAAKAGIRWLRVDIKWDELSKVAGQYHWDGLDHIVATAAKHGITPYFLLMGGYQPWQTAVKPPYHVNNGHCPPIAKWKEHVKAVAERYKGKVRHYQIWGEEDTRCVFYPFTPEAYLEVLKASHEVLKAVDPATKVLLGGFCAAFGNLKDTTHDQNDNCWPAPEFYRLKPQGYFDITCVHLYSQGTPGQTWDPLFQATKKTVEYLKTQGEGGKPLWNTETDFFSSKLNPGGVGGFSGRDKLLTERAQAERLAQWYVQSLALGIKVNTWYIFNAEGPGIVNSDFSPKPAFVAHVNLANKLNGVVFTEELQLGGNLRAYRFRTATGGERLVAWTVGGSELLAVNAPEISDLWGNVTTRNAAGALVPFELGESPVYFDNPSGKLELLPLIEATAPNFCVKGRPMELALTLRNPGAKPSHALVRVACGDGAPKEESVPLAPGAVEKRTLAVPAPKNGAVEYSVQFSGGLSKDFSGALACRMRQALDLAPGPASLAIDSDTQVVIGKAEYDSQNRLMRQGAWRGPSDLGVKATLKRDGGGIAFKIDVTDDKVVPCPKGGERQRYNFDCVELFFDFQPSRSGNRPLQFCVSPDGQFATYGGEPLPGFVVVGSKTAAGYALEGRFDLPPKCGDAFGFDITVDDTDDASPPKTVMAWTGGAGNAFGTNGYGVVTLTPIPK